jgi:hypothetical protein
MAARVVFEGETGNPDFPNIYWVGTDEGIVGQMHTTPEVAQFVFERMNS